MFSTARSYSGRVANECPRMISPYSCDTEDLLEFDIHANDCTLVRRPQAEVILVDGSRKCIVSSGEILSIRWRQHCSLRAPSDGPHSESLGDASWYPGQPLRWRLATSQFRVVAQNFEHEGWIPSVKIGMETQCPSPSNCQQAMSINDGHYPALLALSSFSPCSASAFPEPFFSQ